MTLQTDRRPQQDGAATKKKNRQRKKKKRKISKHVLKAQEEKQRQQQQSPAEPGQSLSNSRPSTSTKNNEKPVKVKDPSEAASYLRDWKRCKASRPDETTTPPWKFNKNTQSWLIRHMYETQKVNKTTFGLLLEYLPGLQGDGAKHRIRAEAQRRVLRYKQYEKSRSVAAERSEEDNDEDEQEDTPMKDSSQEKGETKKTPSDSTEAVSSEQTSPLKEESTTTAANDDDDEVRWRKLSDHDKRKEYKRARKVLEEVVA